MTALSVTDFMAQPSTHYEPTDPPARIRRVVDAAEFNRLALAWGADVEPDGDYAVAVIGDVEYAVALGDEVTC